jgi:GNAT superfamily N-acetyltransferase
VLINSGESSVILLWALMVVLVGAAVLMFIGQRTANGLLWTIAISLLAMITAVLAAMYGFHHRYWSAAVFCGSGFDSGNVCASQVDSPSDRSEQMTTSQIRPIREGDAPAAATLCEQLGYPADARDVLARVRQIMADPGRSVLVACVDDAVVGWMDLSIEYHLQSEPVALIGGLVVAEAMRGHAIGRQLCQAAEGWARGRGMTRIRVRSNAIRERAHAFYLRDGYARVKTSAVFEKTLA